MNIRIPCLVAACTLALVACGDKPSRRTDAASPPTAAPSAGIDATAPAQAAPGPGSDEPTAVVADCTTQIEGNDAMQYNVRSITVPAACTEFTITLKHPGQMPMAAMGHNIVITTAADMKAVAADGIGAGLDADYVKPGDPRVIAYSKVIGGGDTTSMSFQVSKIQGGGPYRFFCSFPGHSSIMKGTISVE